VTIDYASIERQVRRALDGIRDPVAAMTRTVDILENIPHI
jgi:hypothetical protein